MDINISKIGTYIIFLLLFICGQSFSMWGQFMTLPFKNLTMWQAYKMAIPFAWLDWLFMTFSIQMGDKYDLVTPTQDTFLLIIIQFSLILLINHFYLKQKIYKSDIMAFFIILFGFYVSFSHFVSKLLHFPLPINKPIHDITIKKKIKFLHSLNNKENNYLTSDTNTNI